MKITVKKYTIFFFDAQGNGDEMEFECYGLRDAADYAHRIIAESRCGLVSAEIYKMDGSRKRPIKIVK